MDKSEKTPAEGSPDRYCVLVVGMHRSGTSALTRMFSLLGCDLPKTIMGGNETNETGHWESTPICRLNDRILESAGTSWDDWQAINPGWFRSPRAAQFRDEALALLREEFGESRLFVFKDPRLCRLAPFWLDVLEAAGVRPLVVTPVRNPLEVAASLEKRNGFDPSIGLLMWLRHVLDAEAATRGLPRYFTSYDRLLAGWGRLAADAAEALGMSWPRQSERTAIEIETFLSDRLRHHRAAPEAVVDNPLHAAWLRDAYRILAGWAEDGERGKDEAQLDRIRDALDAAAPAFARAVETGRQAFGRVQALAREAEAARRQAAEREQALAQAKAERDARAQEIEQARGALGEARDRLSRLESELAQRRHEAEEMRAAAARAETARTETQERLARAEADCARLEQVAEKAQADRRHLQERLDAQIEETAKLTRMLRERDEEAVRARTRSDELAERLREKEAAAARAEGELARARREAEAAAAEKRDLSARLDARFGEIATLTRMLREREDAAAMLDRAVEKAMNGAEWRFLPARLRLWRRMQALRASGLFDAEWYVARYGDVAADATARRDPLRHFAAHGWAEGRAPNAALAAWKGEE